MTLVATVLGSSMAYVTAINVALPVIGADLGIDLGGQQWIVLAYSLSLASLYLVAGALGDRLGRRKMFILGTIGFAAVSILGGIAPDEAVLIVARVFQGAAGALLTTGSLSLLRSTFGDASGRAIGIWTTGTGVVSAAASRASRVFSDSLRSDAENTRKRTGSRVRPSPIGDSSSTMDIRAPFSVEIR